MPGLSAAVDATLAETATSFNDDEAAQSKSRATRRKFYEIAKADGSPIALEAVRRIAEIYALEGQIRGMLPAERIALRQQSSRPLVDSLRTWLEGQLPRLSARGKLAEAIRYALTRWDGLSART